jgi:hypothetical protein
MDNRIIQIASGVPPADPETAQKFNKWLEDKHIFEIFKYPGISKAMHCKRIDLSIPFTPVVTDYPLYITLFEFANREMLDKSRENPDILRAAEDGIATWGIDVGIKKIWFTAYEVVRTWEK